MPVECQKGKKLPSAFYFYIIATEIDKFHSCNLFSKLYFAVEIQEFRLSIVVIILIVPHFYGFCKYLLGCERIIGAIFTKFHL